MSEPPPISVVIPCYNAARWIRATLTSVLAQQAAPPFEVIVVDDGSSDDSAAIVANEFPQARLLRQSNAGVAAARNAGIDAASGEWVAFVDADDWWLPDKLQRQWRALQTASSRQPPPGLCCSAWATWMSDAPRPAQALLDELATASVDMRRWAGPDGWIYPQLLLDSQVWTSTVLARRDLLRAAGGFDPTLRIGEDLDLWLRLSRLTPVLRVSRPLALYRVRPDSLTRGAPSANHQAQVIERALLRWGYASPDGGRADPSAVARTLAGTWSDFAGAHLAAGNRGQARRGACMALRQCWRQANAWKLLARSLLPGVDRRPQ